MGLLQIFKIKGRLPRQIELFDKYGKSPSNPKHKIDIYLQPLIDKLYTLWDNDILTYDVLLRQNFMMKVALMWTINDFPAYGIHKVSYFDCHRQFLPLDHPYRRNKNSLRIGVLTHHILIPSCLVLICGRELHTYHFRMTYKKKNKKFLVMVFNIIGKNKVFFGGCRIGTHIFYVITLMSCT
ncbi:hypothetical protein CR513_06090, partial [Mucuna pruriens]